MEIGESVSPPEFVTQDQALHDENTCPWCQPKKKQGKSEKLEGQSPQTDAVGAIPENDGGKLGRKLKRAKQAQPEDTIIIFYRKGAPVQYESGKDILSLVTYEKTADSDGVPYRVQYAPHHLIPGNESLDGSTLVPFMGDDNAISEYSAGQASKIKAGGFIGYDVNSADNGEWLPSPYALSMRNDWPAEAEVQVVKRRTGLDLGPATEAFKAAYVAAAIAQSGGKQFHMRHLAYSEKVQGILKAVAERLALMSESGICPEAQKGKADDGKFDPPYGLVARLSVLSNNLRRFLTGPLWRHPLYADAKTAEYADDLVATKRAMKTTNRGNINKVV